jgi:hypothetical protein
MIIIAGTIITFFALFFLLQIPSIYHSTLGKISANYVHINNKQKFLVEPYEKPYEHITGSNTNRWDATLFRAVRDSSYSGSDKHNKERLAFFPLYPLVWKLSFIDSPLIFIFNYLLFAAGLLLLFNLLCASNKPIILIIALAAPFAVIFYLPYAESLFLLTFAISVWGLFQKKYWLFFVGAFGFAMTRPAVLIFIFALIAADICYWYAHRNFRYLFKEMALKTAPFILGFFTVVMIQFSYSGSFSAYFDSLAIWPSETGFLNKIVDWSIEGFGMSVFSIFFFAIPCLIYSMQWGLQQLKSTDKTLPPSLFRGDASWIKEYLFKASVLFTAGNIVYTFLTSGNSLNGFYRYTMAVPCFYIILFLAPEKLKSISRKKTLILFSVCLLAMCAFLALVEYGGNRFSFQYAGLYLSVLLLLFFLSESWLSKGKRIIIGLILAAFCILWQTYLFNMYLSEGWLFT